MPVKTKSRETETELEEDFINNSDYNDDASEYEDEDFEDEENDTSIIEDDEE